MVGLTGLDSLAGLVWCRVVFHRAGSAKQNSSANMLKLSFGSGTMPKNKSCDWLMVRAVSCDWSVVCGV